MGEQKQWLWIFRVVTELRVHKEAVYNAGDGRSTTCTYTATIV